MGRGGGHGGTEYIQKVRHCEVAYFPRRGCFNARDTNEDDDSIESLPGVSYFIEVTCI